MCKEDEKRKFEDDLKGCALRHIGEERELISKGKVEDADVELSYAEKHFKEKDAFSITTLGYRGTNFHGWSLSR